MEGMFSNTTFDQDITSWNVSNVTNMKNMFLNNTTFDQNISNWDTSSATTMEYMFNGATVFNQDVSSWNVKNVTTMVNMFAGTTAFSQNTGTNVLWDWPVNSVEDFSGMFSQSGTTLVSGNTPTRFDFNVICPILVRDTNAVTFYTNLMLESNTSGIGDYSGDRDSGSSIFQFSPGGNKVFSIEGHDYYSYMYIYT
jgi:surface protein